MVNLQHLEIIRDLARMLRASDPEQGHCCCGGSDPSRCGNHEYIDAGSYQAMMVLARADAVIAQAEKELAQRVGSRPITQTEQEKHPC